YGGDVLGIALLHPPAVAFQTSDQEVCLSQVQLIAEAEKFSHLQLDLFFLGVSPLRDDNGYLEHLRFPHHRGVGVTAILALHGRLHAVLLLAKPSLKDLMYGMLAARGAVQVERVWYCHHYPNGTMYRS